MLGYDQPAPDVKIPSIYRRIGVFTIRRDTLFADLDFVMKALEGCIIVRAELLHWSNSFEFMALNAAFDEIENGCAAPTYVAKRSFVEENGNRVISRFDGWERVTP